MLIEISIFQLFETGQWVRTNCSRQRVPHTAFILHGKSSDEQS